jgi:hypothetical protein
MPGYATPEEAARGDIPAEFVHVVALVERGGTAIVAQVVNDFPGAYEIDTATCYRDDDGSWSASNGNGDSAFIRTGARLRRPSVRPDGVDVARARRRAVHRCVDRSRWT